MRISLGDVSLWFDVSGPSVIPRGDTTVERPVLVAVHGGPGLDHLTVKSALGPLAEDFQVVYFDLRGHGHGCCIVMLSSLSRGTISRAGRFQIRCPPRRSPLTPATGRVPDSGQCRWRKTARPVSSPSAA